MKLLRLTFILFLLYFSTGKLLASKVEKGFEALSIYDFFKAKKIFYDINKSKFDPYASYGLSIIYSRNNNPFYDLDSAAKYSYLSFNVFKTKPIAEKFFNFFVSEITIYNVADSVGIKKFLKIKKDYSLEAYNDFLRNFYLTNKKTLAEAVYLRDELEFNAIMQINRSDSTHAFILEHPESSFFVDAKLLYDRELFDETTFAKTDLSYIEFLRKYPNNVMVNTAYEKLFQMYRGLSSIEGLTFFVNNYQNAPQNIEAWKLLFSLSVKAFSYVELKSFLGEHPDFPLKNSILKELELNKLILYPYQQGDFTGFIDAKGKFLINPVYDAATDFYEGLAVVNKNDSVFFINKENVNVFEKIYSDASVFKNGIAPVKQNKKWHFINRQGQTVSKTYDEINELSDEVYVVKLKDKYGALDRFGQTIIEPKYDKLGEFKNDYAYYLENGHYGFISKSGVVHKAEFEWISDFDTNQLAIYKKAGKFGLVNSQGHKILDAQYDQILTTNSSVFIIVQANFYGFFSSNGCFLTAVAYDYLKEKPSEFYTNGRLFKLIKKKEQAFIDENGYVSINFGVFDEINFASHDLIRIKKKNKYGFLDRKLKIVIPYKFEQAEDFLDSLALVKSKDKYSLINLNGQEIFSSESMIQKLSQHYYTISDGSTKFIIANNGKGVQTDIESIQKVSSKVFVLTLDNGDIKVLQDW